MRPIDADRLLWVLDKNFGHTGGAIVMRQLIDIQPTLASPGKDKDNIVPAKAPNEPLTCEGCYWQTHGSFGNCVDCMRGKDKDNYRRPPERQGGDADHA